MKDLFNETSNSVCEGILQDYIDNIGEDDNISMIMSKLPMLIDNNMGFMISDTSYLYGAYPDDFRIACKFVQKYDKTLEKRRRKLNEYDYGGKDNVEIRDNKKLVELARCQLCAGKYFVQIGKSDYCVFNITDGGGDEYGEIKFTLYIISDKWEKYRKKFDNLAEKYKELKKSEKNEYISYTDGRPSVISPFKPFDQVVFKDKESLIKYIDNWVSNIPYYYNEYHMIAKLSILLYGDPGTGKSTVSKAIANHLGIERVTSVSPSYFSFDVENNMGNYRRRYNGVGHSSVSTIYVIDDIDCICKSREDSDDKENGIILSNLLSFLDNPPSFLYKAKDGVKYPVSIVVATTNYYDKLDSAVKRYGRFDLPIEMKVFDKDQAQEMCNIYKLKLEDIVSDCNTKDFTISPSKLQALCLENVDSKLKNVD